MTEEFVPYVIEYYEPNVNLNVSSSPVRQSSTTKEQQDLEIYNSANPLAPIEFATTENPTFVGVVTLPEVETTINDLTAATTNYVNQIMDSKINSLIAGAPNALDTLKELSTAINDDSNFAGTVTTALSNRYTKTETDTLLNGKVNVADNIPMSKVTNLEATLLSITNEQS